MGRPAGRWDHCFHLLFGLTLRITTMTATAITTTAITPAMTSSINDESSVEAVEYALIENSWDITDDPSEFTATTL